MSDKSKGKSASQSVVKVNDSTLRQLVGYNMKRAFNAVQADLARTLRPFELRMITYSALVIIADNPGLRQSQLADALAIERPNLVVIIDELEKKGLISRKHTLSDRRAYALEITPLGQELNDNAVVAVSEHEQNLFKDMKQEERETLLRLLNAAERGAKGKRT